MDTAIESFFLLLLAVVLLHSPTASSVDPQPGDFSDPKLYAAYGVIQRFKSTVTCDPLSVTSSWTGTDICASYQGFYCDHPPNDPSSTAVAAVDFNGFGLCAPSLSGFLDQLPDLAFFHANSNKFSGPIPDLSAIPYFYELDLSNNQFSGPFPSNVLRISTLTFLDLRYNSFSGSLPAGVFSLGVQVLFLNNNGFNGQVPANVGSTKAKYLTLANNGFAGGIPSGIGDAAATMTELVLQGNALSGCLPSEIGRLKQLTLFDAADNRLTGPIPSSFACLEKLEQLNLAGNKLYGTVPEALCALGSLRTLLLSGNFFTVVGTTCQRLQAKGILDISNNCVKGLLGQRPISDCLGFLGSALSCSVQSILPCKLPCIAGIGIGCSRRLSGVDRVVGGRKVGHSMSS